MPTPLTRDQIALECLKGLMGSGSFSIQLMEDTGDDEGLPVLAHNTAVDAFVFADAFLAVASKPTLP